MTFGLQNLDRVRCFANMRVDMKQFSGVTRVFLFYFVTGVSLDILIKMRVKDLGFADRRVVVGYEEGLGGQSSYEYLMSPHLTKPQGE